MGTRSATGAPGCCAATEVAPIAAASVIAHDHVRTLDITTSLWERKNRRRPARDVKRSRPVGRAGSAAEKSGLVAAAGLGDLLDDLLGLPVLAGHAHEIGLRDDADERAALVDDRDPAHLLASHECHRLLDRIVGGAGLHATGHDVAH